MIENWQRANRPFSFQFQHRPRAGPRMGTAAGWEAILSRLQYHRKLLAWLQIQVPRSASQEKDPCSTFRAVTATPGRPSKHGTAFPVPGSGTRVPNFQTTANRGLPTTFLVHSVRGTSVPVLGRRVPQKYITANIEMKAILLQQVAASTARGERDLGRLINNKSGQISHALIHPPARQRR